MNSRSFNEWLFLELASARLALYPLYEERDKLIYIDGPALKEKYMSQFAESEKNVLELELDVKLLESKLEMIQAAVNRREPVDLEGINACLEEERNAILSEMNKSDTVKELSPEDMDRLQEAYREIIENFHPGINKSMTRVQKELYAAAMEAYRNLDIDQLILLNDMLHADDERDFERYVSAEEDISERYNKIARVLSTDYSLAAELFTGYVKTSEDESMLDAIEEYNGQMENLLEEIKNIKNDFPFNAEGMLSSDEGIEGYGKELEMRKYQAEKRKVYLEEKITELVVR